MPVLSDKAASWVKQLMVLGHRVLRRDSRSWFPFGHAQEVLSCSFLPAQVRFVVLPLQKVVKKAFLATPEQASRKSVGSLPRLQACSTTTATSSAHSIVYTFAASGPPI